MQTNDEKRIHAYFESQSLDDEAFVAQQFANSANENELKVISEKHWNDSDAEKVDLRHILRRIHLQIRPQKEATTFNHVFVWYSRFAAFLLLPALLLSLYFGYMNAQRSNSFTSIESPKGSRVRFQLPDGTTGTLNSESQLQYFTSFNKARAVTLQGEAFFDVTEDAAHPFVVKTRYADIQVLGTRFDVCAYPDDQHITTTLEKGQVQVFNKLNSTRDLLAPGDQNHIQLPSGMMSKKKVDTRYYTSWKEETLQFDNTPIFDVFTQMERWYGVQFVLETPIKESQNLTMTIKTESLREMMQLLALTNGFSFRIEGKEVFINTINK